MLAELAAANAAFAVIKQAVSNSGDLMKAGKAIGEFIGAKEELQRKANQKRARGVAANDLEEFFALERIREYEESLKQMMLLSGRPGLYRDYQKFCEQAKDGRAQAQREAIRRRQKIVEGVGATLVGLVLVGALVGLVAWMLHLKGII